MPYENFCWLLRSYTTGPGPGRRGRKRKDAKSTELVTTDEEGGEASEVEDVMINGNAKKPRASFDSVHEPCRKQSLEQTPHVLQVGRNLLKHTHSASHRGTLESKKLQSTLAATSTHV